MNFFGARRETKKRTVKQQVACIVCAVTTNILDEKTRRKNISKKKVRVD